ncbi:hypothetical protein CYMTET_56738 [Cymbomonas tetramitiformis]|uniref:PH domain-containing protein n=1 Tax=Cymbomonas tetramitiformis TaxID=36881 RepID=A0AAE0BBK5_9CHLO|nr:hypothetical protein CYMTET_56738 [Cymbomonas tetramitiformis]
MASLKIEIARSWAYKFRHQPPHVWEYRLFILYSTNVVDYFSEGAGGTLLPKGQVDVASLQWQMGDPSPPSWVPSGWDKKGVMLIFAADQLNKGEAKRKVYCIRFPSVESKQLWHDALSKAKASGQDQERTAEAGAKPAEKTLLRSASIINMQCTKHLAEWLLPLHQSKIIKCGWLLKWKDTFPKKWQRRLFVLRSDFVIRYYADAEMSTLEEKGEIELRKLKLVAHDKQDVIAFDAVQANKNNRWRPYLLSASRDIGHKDPQAEIDNWRQTILFWCQRAVQSEGRDGSSSLQEPDSPITELERLAREAPVSLESQNHKRLSSVDWEESPLSSTSVSRGGLEDPGCSDDDLDVSAVSTVHAMHPGEMIPLDELARLRVDSLDATNTGPVALDDGNYLETYLSDVESIERIAYSVDQSSSGDRAATIDYGMCEGFAFQEDRSVDVIEISSQEQSLMLSDAIQDGEERRADSVVLDGGSKWGAVFDSQ